MAGASVSTSGGIPAPDPATLNPTGSIVMFGGVVLPDGWLWCDGSAVSRTTYVDLFAQIGIKFGAGDTFTTFNLPDFRNVLPYGANVPADIGTVAGNATHTHGVGTYAAGAHTHGTSAVTVDSHTHSMQSHTHSMQSHTHTSAAHTHPLSGTNAQAQMNLTTTDIFQRRVVGSGFTATHTASNVGQTTSTAAQSNSIGVQGATDSTTPGATGAPSTASTGAPSTASTGTASVNTVTGSTDSETPTFTGTSAAADNLPPVLTVGFIIKT